MSYRSPIAAALFLAAACIVSAQDAAPAAALRLEPTATPNRFRWEHTPEPGKAVIQGFLAYPQGPGPFPAVILNHGSNGTASNAMQRFAKAFLDGGYVVLACDLAHASGNSDRNPAESRRRLLACLDLLGRDAKVDAGKIVMYGNSYGSFVTLAVCTLTDRIRAAAFTGGGMPRRAEDQCDLAKMSTPLLILHGESDTVVPVLSARRLKEALDAAGKPSELRVFENVGHELPEARKGEVFPAILAWFEKALAATPGPEPAAEPRGTESAPPGASEPRGTESAEPAAKPERAGAGGAEDGTALRIQWYGTWAQAKAEAARLQRPILLVSAAPQCHGIPGIW